jgi:hypothetical protein
MDDVECRGRLPYLVRLEMSDEMSPEWKTTSSEDLRLTLLHLVLAEVDLTGGSGSADDIEGECL